MTAGPRAEEAREAGPDEGDDLGHLLRAVAAEIERAGIPPHLEALARQLGAGLAARADSAPDGADPEAALPQSKG